MNGAQLSTDGRGTCRVRQRRAPGAEARLILRGSCGVETPASFRDEFFPAACEVVCFQNAPWAQGRCAGSGTAGEDRIPVGRDVYH